MPTFCTTNTTSREHGFEELATFSRKMRPHAAANNSGMPSIAVTVLRQLQYEPHTLETQATDYTTLDQDATLQHSRCVSHLRYDRMHTSG